VENSDFKLLKRGPSQPVSSCRHGWLDRRDASAIVGRERRRIWLRLRVVNLGADNLAEAILQRLRCQRFVVCRRKFKLSRELFQGEARRLRLERDARMVPCCCRYTSQPQALHRQGGTSCQKIPGRT
jgi:hypothetical protein